MTGTSVATTATVHGRLGAHARSRPPANVVRLGAGVVVATCGAALVGLEGPRTAGLAAACAGAFVGGWWLLHVRAPDAADPAAGAGAGAGHDQSMMAWCTSERSSGRSGWVLLGISWVM